MAERIKSAWIDSVTPSCPPSAADHRRMRVIAKHQSERVFLTLDSLMFLWEFERSLWLAQRDGVK